MRIRKRKNSFDDSQVREVGVVFFKEVLGYDFISNPLNNKIDLINPNNKNNGAELEHGGWDGNLWENKGYCEISKMGFPTINIPIRKTKYWYDRINGLYLPNRFDNYFLRTNKDFTQMILIKPTTIRSLKKVLWTEFRATNSFAEEKWMSFKKEHVETYDLIDGKFKLQKK